MIIANKADTCMRSFSVHASVYVCDTAFACIGTRLCVCAHARGTVRVQALGALPPRLGSKQCLFSSSCLWEMAVCARADIHTHTHAFRKMKMKASGKERG